MSVRLYMDYKFTFHVDSSHGWVECPIELYKILQFKVSPYSYYDNKNQLLYLEEDCDAVRFRNAYQEKFKKLPDTNHVYHTNRCFIRNLSKCGF